ncbi:unnamed protein product [Ambrosiozyma monospora]|uniref:Unnamed protein product n=1 Tax=Ambrosiozyma monospora TaxID=43982 RepID=A0ACB5T714_AMBMO|nr:unnamed protein product [Ambrosiozyma monospora]
MLVNKHETYEYLYRLFGVEVTKEEYNESRKQPQKPAVAEKKVEEEKKEDDVTKTVEEEKKDEEKVTPVVVDSTEA